MTSPTLICRSCNGEGSTCSGRCLGCGDQHVACAETVSDTDCRHIREVCSSCHGDCKERCSFCIQRYAVDACDAGTFCDWCEDEAKRGAA